MHAAMLRRFLAWSFVLSFVSPDAVRADPSFTGLGRLTRPDSASYAWLAVIPEPDGNLLVLAGVLALLGLDRRRRARAPERFE